MAHPSSHYIKFMILQGFPDETQKTVNMTLRSFGFPEISEDEFGALEASMHPMPTDFAFHDKHHKSTIEYLKDQGLFSLWMERKEDYEAVDIINYPQIRETIQLLLLGRFESKDIVERVKMKFNRELSTQSISSFKHYFWNSDCMGMADLKVLFFAHPMRDAYMASMWGSQNQSLFRAGFSPQIDGRKALREAHRNLAMRIEASRILPDGKDTARIITSLSKELVTVHNALYGEGAGVEDMMKDLQKFVMERKAPNVISIHKLAPKGNFSGSGAKESSEEKA